MRLGAPCMHDPPDPDAWVADVQRDGWNAAFCPLPAPADAGRVAAYAEAARRADIVIAEVGAWSNPMSRDGAEAGAARMRCRESLDLADRIGARCCVNIAGSRGPTWSGPDAADLDEETLELLVDVLRGIIDDVRPTRSFYTLETMPWMYPDSPDAYLRLIRAVDRPAFAVHLDPVNLINSPRRYFNNGALIEECFDKLGPYIRSCHAKDIRLHDRLTVHLDEAPPGEGALDYRTFFRCLKRLDPEIPVLMEHLSSREAYRQATAFLRFVADTEGL